MYKSLSVSSSITVNRACASGWFQNDSQSNRDFTRLVNAGFVGADDARVIRITIETGKTGERRRFTRPHLNIDRVIPVRFVSDRSSPNIVLGGKEDVIPFEQKKFDAEDV